ncbi:endonuclease Q family protein [Anoxybacillus gonensis]|uniref:endonuclease Q family protein n=1 Tax=Anoxybacillus gonensis TaxID=198467 RepID=UPI0002BF54D0|nr:endonuclease Q family protein [Anoxybacillus gonensis]EMI09776.1 hypothetical protein F510_2165 [Anoxybacillus gonensis]
MMNRYFVDLHIHIGRTASQRPVKITGAKSLTLSNIVQEATYTKGLQMIGIVDAHVPEILQEIEQHIEKHRWMEHEDGGIITHGVTMLLGSEIEIYDDHCQGPIHVLVFFPTIDTMRKFSDWMASYVKNRSLSSQRIYVSGKHLQEQVKKWGGLFILAHAFTPFKSVYGKGVKKSLTEVFDPSLIDAVELGLSADTTMADQIEELHRYCYVSNSDAHSLKNIAREYQMIAMKEATFAELKKALRHEQERKIMANYGLNPKLGKYYRTTCARCLSRWSGEQCERCGHRQQIVGVYERLQQLRTTSHTAVMRPPYIPQVPLSFIPGIGERTYKKLIERVGTEMYIMHEASEDELAYVAGQNIAKTIIAARNGTLQVHEGGGGKYGKVKSPE